SAAPKCVQINGLSKNTNGDGPQFQYILDPRIIIHLLSLPRLDYPAPNESEILAGADVCVGGCVCVCVCVVCVCVWLSVSMSVLFLCLSVWCVCCFFFCVCVCVCVCV